MSPKGLLPSLWIAINYLGQLLSEFSRTTASSQRDRGRKMDFQSFEDKVSAKLAPMPIKIAVGFL